jgi:hypothetical protein
MVKGRLELPARPEGAAALSANQEKQALRRYLGGIADGFHDASERL